MTIIVIVAYLYRDSIARDVANRALRDQDVSVVNLSVESIGTNLVEFAELVLEQSDGSRIRINGISLPLDLRSPRPTDVTIESVALEQSSEERPPPAFAVLLQTFLDTPIAIANTTVRVKRLSIPKLPPMANLLWQSGETGQSLQLDIERFRTSIEVAERTGTGYQATLSILNADGSEASLFDLNIQRSDDGLTVEGTTRVDLTSWLPVYHLLGVVPEEIVALDALLEGPVAIEIYNDSQLETAVTARLSPTGNIVVDYQAGDGSMVHAGTVSISPILTTFQYPSLKWSAAIESGELLVSTDTLDELPVRIDDMQCAAGIVCSLSASLDAGPLEISGWAIDTIDTFAPITIQSSGDVRIEISDDASFMLAGLQRSGTSIAGVTSSRISGTALDVDDNGWHLNADALVLNLSEISTDTGMTASFPVELSKLTVDNSGTNISSHYSIATGAMKLTYGDTGIATPGAEGELSIRGDEFESQLLLNTPDSGLLVDATVTHNRSTETGGIEFSDARLSFSDRPLSSMLLKWPYAWDVIDGSWQANGQLEWAFDDEDVHYAGELRHVFDNLAGTNNESAFAGLNTEFTLVVDSVTGASIPSTTMSLELLDVGVPVQDVSADFSLDGKAPALVVDTLSMSLLGGKLFADPFRFDPESSNDIVLRPESVQLEFIVGLLDFEKLSMSGSVGGRLPLTVTKERITIDGGRLESDASGGSIRYGTGASDLETVDSPVGLVSRALANFQFDSLASDVSYNEAGDLVLQMRLEGVNPDMDATQPVVLNLNVENNVPQMLKSLRATRSIQEILENKVAK